MFEGFSEETIAFFMALRMNNNREFFESNRPAFERVVKQPLTTLAEALAPVALQIDPQLDIRPSRTISRIHRDLRFRKDKTPYRDYMWIGFRRPGESRMETCGFYFDISSESAHWGCGFYHMQAETMQRFRELLVREPTRVARIIRSKALSERFSLLGDAYQRQHQPPTGMPDDLGNLYRKKAVYAEHRLESIEMLFSPALADTVAADFLVLAPFYDLLRACMVRRVEGVEE